MNICLTMKCNNHCSYCFQKNDRNIYPDMTLDMLKKILDWIVLRDNECIKVLGGEPTLFKDFDKALELILNKSENIIIITNLLGLDSNINLIKDLIFEKNNIFILINTTSDNDKKEKFRENLFKLYQSNPYNLSLSLTLTADENLNEENFLNLKNILKDFPLISHIRFGCEIPTPNNNFEFHNYTSQSLNFIKDLKKLNKNIKIGFDCGITKCILDTSFLDIYKVDYSNNLGCASLPLDIYPNGSARYCYSSLKDYLVNNIFDYDNSIMLERYFISLEYSHKVKNSICLNCEYYKKGECIPCHSIDDAIYETELRGKRD